MPFPFGKFDLSKWKVKSDMDDGPGMWHEVKMTIPRAVRSEDGRTRILDAALDEFAVSGFKGTSLRRIAEQAGTMHQLLVYHFKTKDGLWRAVIEHLLTEIDSLYRSTDLGGAPPPEEALRRNIRAFVRFTARHPQFHRIWTFESQANSDRFRWLVEQYVRPHFLLMTDQIRAAQKAGLVRAGDPARMHYALIGIITTNFVFALEVETVASINPFSVEEIEHVVATACDFLGLDP